MKSSQAPELHSTAGMRRHWPARAATAAAAAAAVVLVLALSQHTSASPAGIAERKQQQRATATPGTASVHENNTTSRSNPGASAANRNARARAGPTVANKSRGKTERNQRRRPAATSGRASVHENDTTTKSNAGASARTTLMRGSRADYSNNTTTRPMDHVRGSSASRKRPAPPSSKFQRSGPNYKLDESNSPVSPGTDPCRSSPFKLRNPYATFLVSLCL